MTHDTGRNTINKVNVTIYFGLRKGFGGLWSFGTFLSDSR